MNTFITISGWLAVVLALGAILAAVVGLTIGAYRTLTGWFYDKAYAEARSDIGMEVTSASWWFSESKNTQKCLEILGKHLAAGGRPYSNAERWREEWRREKASRTTGSVIGGPWRDTTPSGGGEG